MAHLSHSAHAVVRHAVDDDGRATDAVAFVAHFLVLNTFQAAGGLGDAVFDVFSRHIGRLGLVNGQAKTRVGAQITASHAGGNHDFAHDAGPDTLAFFILPALAVLNIRPFTVSGHEKSFSKG